MGWVLDTGWTPCFLMSLLAFSTFSTALLWTFPSSELRLGLSETILCWHFFCGPHIYSIFLMLPPNANIWIGMIECPLDWLKTRSWFVGWLVQQFINLLVFHWVCHSSPFLTNYGTIGIFFVHICWSLPSHSCYLITPLNRQFLK